MFKYFIKLRSACGLNYMPLNILSEATAKVKRSYLKSMQTDPPGGTELRFTMTPSDVVQGIYVLLLLLIFSTECHIKMPHSIVFTNCTDDIDFATFFI